MPETLILTRSEIREIVTLQDALDTLREAFRVYSLERTTRAQRLPVPLPKPAPQDASAMVILPGLIPGVPAYTRKGPCEAPGPRPGHPRRHRPPRELTTGVPLALLESTYLTALRTGLAGSLGADVLSRGDAGNAQFIRV